MKNLIDAVDVARFWSKVDVGTVHQCWPWKAAIHPEGYGSFKVAGNHRPAHRVALTIFYGLSITSDIIIRHQCDTPACCNPYHLTPGTHADNVADRVARDRSARGERNGRAKVTEDQVRAIRADPRPNVAICREYGLCNASVSNIKNRRTWTHVKDEESPATHSRPKSEDVSSDRR